jgi:hypothetical protein
MKKLKLLFFFAALPFCSMAQSKLLRGISLTAGYNQLPNYKLTRIMDGAVQIERTNRNATVLGFNYILRANVLNIGPESSLALDVRPTFSFYIAKEKESYSVFGVVTTTNIPVFLQLPMLLQYNWGLLSNRETTANRGFGIGVGVNYQRLYDAQHYNLNRNYFPENEYVLETGEHAILQPTINLSYRFWGIDDYCFEYNFNVGLANETFQGNKYSRNTYMFSISYYFNY